MTLIHSTLMDNGHKQKEDDRLIHGAAVWRPAVRLQLFYPAVARHL